MAENKVLTPEEELALKQAEEQKKIDDALEERLKNLTPEQEEEIIKKRFGTTSDQLIKKEEQIKVLTEAEKKELEEKESGEALIWAIDKGQIKKSDYDSYLELKATDKVAIARKKFIEQNKEYTPEEAGKVFDKIIKLEEDDEIADPKDPDKVIPNSEKIAAKKWAEALAEEEIDNRFGKKIKTLPERHKAFLATEKIKQQNADIITKAITEIPKRMEVEVEGITYGVDLSQDDLTAAHNLAIKEVLTKPDLKADEVKETASIYLFAKNVKRIVAEAVTIAYKKGVDDTGRGAKGIKDKPDITDTEMKAKEDFAKKHNLI